MTDVQWSGPALRDLRRIDPWLTSEASAETAVRLLTAVRFRAEFLVDFPRGGRPHRGDTRILRVFETPYLIHYRITLDMGVQVLRVHHERQDWQVEI